MPNSWMMSSNSLIVYAKQSYLSRVTMVSGSPDSVVSVRDKICGDQYKDMDPIWLSDYISDKIRFPSFSK